MIDIDQVNKLEAAALEERIKSERKQQEANEASRVKTIAEAEQGKLLAEQDFPKALECIERAIASAVQNKERKVIYNCNLRDNNFASMYLRVMLISALPLNGFICMLHGENSVRISW